MNSFNPFIKPYNLSPCLRSLCGRGQTLGDIFKDNDNKYVLTFTSAPTSPFSHTTPEAHKTFLVFSWLNHILVGYRNKEAP